MARRKKNKGLVEILLDQPWWVSFILGCISFICLRWILPKMFNGNPLLSSLEKLSTSAAFISALFFWFFALVQFTRSNSSGNKMPIVTGSKIEPVVYAKSPVDASQIPETNNSRNSKSTDLLFTTWSLAALRAMEWKRFELLTAKYYEMIGFRSETIRCGADGGIDVKLFKSDLVQPVAIVQCKAWNTSSVGVKEIRELLGVMTHEKVKRGIFITTGNYTTDANSFGSTNPIQMLDGNGFLSKIMELPEHQQQELIRFAFDGDYTTPTCASCGIKMKKRESKRGPFWGCLNYPRCKSKFPITV